MWCSTVALVNGKHRYLTAETFGFKVNSNGQQLRRRQQWTIEPFPELAGPDGSISSAASVASGGQQFGGGAGAASNEPLEAQANIMQLPSASGPTHWPRPAASSSAGSEHSVEAGCDEEHENVAIKSHLNKYLAVDSFGNVTCDSDEKSESARFTITICSMSQAKSEQEHIFWAFKNVERGYYLGTSEDGMICCRAKMPKSRAELWHLHLLPARGASFFALKSVGRKRYARLSPAPDSAASHTSPATTSTSSTCAQQVQLDANLSWGPETLFQFKYFEGGRYALLTSDNRLLTNEGSCVTVPPGPHGRPDCAAPPDECLFTLEYHSGYLAFRDSFGHYLAAAGRSSVLRSRSIGVSRDELFCFETVPMQASLKATFNNRWVSIRQGVDLSANQSETTSKFETFQLSYHRQTRLWSIMTQECQFWTVSKNTSTICVCRPADYEAMSRGQFELVWSDNEPTFCIKFVDQLGSEPSSERWIVARKSGQLYLAGAGGSSSSEPVRFIMRFQNRRLLSLRPAEASSGFVGLRSASSRQLEANKTAPDSIVVEYSDTASSGQQSGQQSGQLQQLALASLGGARAKPPPVARASQQQSVGSADCAASKVASMFNVKLNSTKQGQSMFGARASPTTTTTTTTTTNHAGQAPEPAECHTSSNSQPPVANGLGSPASASKSDCLTIDSNNNEPEAPARMDGVECGAAPSVASIINTFSSVKLAGEPPQQQPPLAQPVSSQAVLKLASCFELEATENGAPSLPNGSAGSSAEFILANDASKLADQVAQAECCYLRLASTSKYLVVGPALASAAQEHLLSSQQQQQQVATNLGPESNLGVLCDATNKACAQSWTLELRNHNSIAIRTSDTQAYMQLGTNGTIYLSRCEPKDATLWEF